MQVDFKTPDKDLMKQITACVKEYVLDDEGLLANQFIAAIHNNRLVGFVRLRPHSDCDELCTLGVIEQYRKKGIGKALVEEVKKKSFKVLYLVCIIPTFFDKLGFNVIENNIPASMKRKWSRCTNDYVVEEEYCVMQLQNKNA